jgi:hypothetical protein
VRLVLKYIDGARQSDPPPLNPPPCFIPKTGGGAGDAAFRQALKI